MKRIVWVPVLVLMAPLGLSAQDHRDHSEHAGKADREIMALSDEEIRGLLEGEGMGYALAAELNGYPGPRHVLDLEEELELTEDQAEAIQDIFRDMNRRARELGARLVEGERELDRLFRDRSVTGDRLEELLREVGGVEAELRFVHLEAHLRTTEHLNHHQIQQYQELRGYGGDHGDHRHH